MDWAFLWHSNRSANHTALHMLQTSLHNSQTLKSHSQMLKGNLSKLNNAAIVESPLSVVARKNR